MTQYQEDTSKMQLKKFCNDKTPIKIKMNDGEIITGTVAWSENYTIALITEQYGEITILKHAAQWYGELKK